MAGIRNRILPNLSVSSAPKALSGINLNDPLFSHLRKAGVGAMELTAGHNTSGPHNPMTDHVAGKGKPHWEQKAVKHPGVEKKAAKKAGETTHQYLEAHKNSPGKAGKRARLGLMFERQAAKRKGK